MFDGIDTGTQRLEHTFGALHMRGDQDVLAVRFVYDRGDRGWVRSLNGAVMPRPEPDCHIGT